MRRLSINIIGNMRRWAIVSTTLVVVSVLAVGIFGLDLSIDFTGGSSFVLEEIDSDVTADELENAATGAGATDVQVQLVTGEDGSAGALVRTEQLPPGSDVDTNVEAALREVANPTTVDESFVGPSWGRRISVKALQALVVFLIAILIYISIRLQFKMAVVAVVTLAHDLIVTVGIYALFGFPVSPNTVIALLTILGYSLYDTVVVFDRIQENEPHLGSPGRRTYHQLVNTSLNEVLWRSLNTSITSLLPVFSLLVFGSQLLGATTLRDLALALFIGMGLGVYSSLFVAGPLLAWWRGRDPDMVRQAAQYDDVDEDELVAPDVAAVEASRRPVTSKYVRGDRRRRK
ncbi:protein translocase subunit SecF [Salsipaludibacter albus]|uniref:protein translocase subunit SecF n=1 Tax=Salsipaludibacter albus TaxID=2849650 RepID=UPI001EE3E2ED|nr:protein translocase subunit SecF [Salsipaludibacter albus]MBY5163957.1 protein translocase subunit SecF [Salsipaludibacter albus]